MISFPPFCNFPLSSVLVKGPLGNMHVTACSAGVHGLEFGTNTDQPDPQYIDLHSIDGQTLEKLPEPAAMAVVWLKTYFETPSRLNQAVVPPFCFMKSTENERRFSDRVLDELLKVKFGETVTYAELAKRAGNAKAGRAVGQAMRSNPVCLMVPCHRVVLTSGGMGHYAGGAKDDLKAWLLKHEAENI